MLSLRRSTLARPAGVATPRGVSLALPSLRRASTLAIAVAGTVGGAVLLTANLLVAASSGVAPSSAVPLLANAALVFGGVMFAREYRRAGREGGRPDHAREPDAPSRRGPGR